MRKQLLKTGVLVLPHIFRQQAPPTLALKNPTATNHTAPSDKTVVTRKATEKNVRPSS
jgi:hypothetical protein